MEATSGGANGHSPPLVMIRQGNTIHDTAERRSMFELSRQTLWEPNQQRLYRVPGSAEQLTSPIAPSTAQFNQPIQPTVYQAHPGNRHSYSGGPVLLPQYGLISEDQVTKSQYTGFSSPTFRQRRSIGAQQRAFDSSSTGGINQCGRRAVNTRSLVLSAVSEDDMSLPSSSSSPAHRGGGGRYGEMVDQGPEMTDSISTSPREGGGSTPQMAPKNRANAAGGGHAQMYPVPGQLLVDPATGQHFIVPTQGAAPAAQPIYYPMYYPPAPHGAPVQAPPQYYGYAPVAGYPMAPLGQFSSRFAVPAYSQMGRQGEGGGGGRYQQAACSTEGDESPKAPASPHFGKGVTSFAAGYHQSRRSEEVDGRPSPPSSQPEDPEGPRDPFRRDVTRSSAEYRLMEGRGSPRGGMMGGGGVAPGSAPVLAQAESSPLWWSSPNSNRQRGKGSFSGESTSYTDSESSSRQQRRITPPSLFSNSAAGAAVSDSESMRPVQQLQHNYYGQMQQAPAAATTFAAQARGGGEREVAQDPSPPMPKPKAIRMEIDLGKTMPEEEELRRKEEERNRVKASRAPPTAFTVSFDGGEEEGEGGGRKGGMTLQDAARRGRMGRRSVGGASRGGTAAAAAAASGRPSTTGGAAAAAGGGSQPLRREESDDKGFLLERLLHGDKARPATADPSPSSSGSSSGVHSMGGGKREADSGSDAGTYVIGQSEARQHSTMITSQIIERDSDSSSSDTETTVSRSPSPPRRVPLAAAASLPAAAAAPSGNAAAAAVNQQRNNGSKQLLSELAKLRQMGGAALSPRSDSSSAAGAASVAPKARQTLMGSMTSRSVFGMAASSAGLTARPSALPPPSASQLSPGDRGERAAAGAAAAAATPPPLHSPQMRAVTGGGEGGSGFRRADGGRFSMRSNGGAAAGGGGPPVGGSPQTAAKRPPFKVGGGRPLAGNVAAEKQRENEMTAWLRRKDYNPMRAAMEAKKQKEMKNRSDQFVNNRSISFHVGNNGQQRPAMRGSELTRVKSSESLHAAEDEARSHASQRVIAEYSRGVVEDINKLTKQHSRTKDQKALSGLAKVVDQLSTKCKKSIELIRAQNKGCLSVSVEDLLASAVEPPRDDECLTDQLDRLSNAFDAVQRYLEQYSLDDKDLSSSEPEEEERGGKRGGGAPSTFSSFSAYRRGGGQPQTAGGRSTFTSINARPGRATNAYRAKLLGGHRSPSGGRPNKNN